MTAPRRPAGPSTVRVRAMTVGGSTALAPVDVDPSALAVEPWGPGRTVVHTADGRDTWALVEAIRPAGRVGAAGGARRLEIVVEGWRVEVEIEDTRRAELRERATRRDEERPADGRLEIRAIIPGRIAAVSVAPGDEIAAGHTLLVIEAMKMQNELRAPRAGRIESVGVGVGETIDLGQLLVVLA